VAPDPLGNAVFGLVGAGVIVSVSISCVPGVHAAGLSRTPGGAGLPSPSAEAAGGVKMESARTERQLAVSAVLLTSADSRASRCGGP